MPDHIELWLQAAGALLIGGGAVAIALRKWLASFITAGAQVDAAGSQAESLKKMRADLERLLEAHSRLTQELITANEELHRVSVGLTRVEQMLLRMDRLLREHGIDVPHDIRQHIGALGGVA